MKYRGVYIEHPLEIDVSGQHLIHNSYNKLHEKNNLGKVLDNTIL